MDPGQDYPATSQVALQSRIWQQLICTTMARNFPSKQHEMGYPRPRSSIKGNACDTLLRG